MRKIALVMGLLLGAIALAGCHEEAPVGGKNINSDIEAGIKDQLKLTMTVECPTKLTKKKGGEFECTATSKDGDVFNVQVKQTDAKGNISWTLDVLATKPVAEQIEEDILRQKKLTVKIDCPDAVKLEPGDTFDCTVEDDKGGKTPLTATIKDEDGNISWKT